MYDEEKRNEINGENYEGVEEHADQEVKGQDSAKEISNQNPVAENASQSQGYQSQPQDNVRQSQPYQNQGQYQNAPYQGQQNPYQGRYQDHRQSYGPNGPYAGNQPYGQYQTHQSYGQNQRNDPYGYSRSYYQAPSGEDGRDHAPKANGSKKKSVLKSAALVTAAAVLFGCVAGGTMFAVNRAAQLLLPAGTQGASVQSQTAPQETIGSTTGISSANSSAASSGNGVVIEDVSAIVEEVMPSVVSITNTMLYRNNSWFGPSQTYEIPSSGSGIIVGQNDTELLIVTNNHVIADANSLSVTFVDKSTVNAAIKGTDAASDLAVIAVPLADISSDTKGQIKTATLGDSSLLKMGQGVIAIGNALGRGQSVTVGHVSALDREIRVDGVMKKVIQTDAAINPGNSGGALLNAKGEVIGINEAKYASEKVEGVGYAIPISYVRDIIGDLMTRTTKITVAEAEQGYLGVKIQNIDASMSKMYDMPQGVYIYKIIEDSAASRSDLREKDIITKVNGEAVTSYADLTKQLTYYKAGETITLTVQYLDNGTYVEREVSIVLGARPEDAQSSKAQNGNP